MCEDGAAGSMVASKQHLLHLPHLHPHLHLLQILRAYLVPWGKKGHVCACMHATHSIKQASSPIANHAVHP